MTARADAGLPRQLSREVDALHHRRRISHDIHHELGTIMLLTALLLDAPDVGPESRRRAALILGETRWLEELQHAYETAAEPRRPSPRQQHQPIHVDEICRQVTSALQDAALTRITVVTTPATACVDRLVLWRSLRNLLDNAVRAAGPDGHVDIRVRASGAWVVIDVDDDGPGFGRGERGRSSLGMPIVRDFVAAVGGQLEIDTGRLGGCGIRLRLPGASQ